MAADTSAPTPAIPLREEGSIPQLGFGVFQIPPKETQAIVEQALAVGYRHVDTAAAYRNEAACARAIRASALGREAVFLTTKCWNEDQGYEEAKAALAGSLDRLGFEYVDLYLIHWPVPSRDLYVDTWRAFVQLHEEGFARAIGVSNFHAEHLRRIIEATGHTPAVNQIELHPYLQQPELRRENERLGIVTEAWSPLAQGLVLADPVITAIAAEHRRTPGQVVIRWHVQLGNVVIPKSVTPQRIRENFDVFDFELSDEDMARIEGLDRGERIGPDPDVFVAP
jgi:diketogulonate reductase-like aldo/keto reductase